jgi:hypothetical protein
MACVRLLFTVSFKEEQLWLSMILSFFLVLKLIFHFSLCVDSVRNSALKNKTSAFFFGGSVPPPDCYTNG